MFQTFNNTDNTVTAYAIIRTVYHAYYILILIFIIFILYLSVFRASAIRSYSFPVNISAQYSFGGLPFFLHYTITIYIFSELFYIIIPSVLSLHDISILFVYPMLHIFHHTHPYSFVPYYIYYLSISMITLYYYIYYYVYYLRFGI